MQEILGRAAHGSH